MVPERDHPPVGLELGYARVSTTTQSLERQLAFRLSIRTLDQLFGGRPDVSYQHPIQVRATDLPHLRAFTRGLDRGREAVNAALTLPYHNGGTEGVNTKTKLIKHQMYGRAGFTLLRCQGT